MVEETIGAVIPYAVMNEGAARVAAFIGGRVAWERPQTRNLETERVVAFDLRLPGPGVLPGRRAIHVPDPAVRPRRIEVPVRGPRRIPGVGVLVGRVTPGEADVDDLGRARHRELDGPGIHLDVLRPELDRAAAGRRLRPSSRPAGFCESRRTIPSSGQHGKNAARSFRPKDGHLLKDAHRRPPCFIRDSSCVAFIVRAVRGVKIRRCPSGQVGREDGGEEGTCTWVRVPSYFRRRAGRPRRGPSGRARACGGGAIRDWRPSGSGTR